MLVRDIMTTPARCLAAGASLEVAIELLVTAKISSIPIVDEDGRVIGILTEADVLRSGLEPDARATLMTRPGPATPWPSFVDEVMTPDPTLAQPTSDVADVAQLMGERGWKSLPVIEQGVAIGVVSRSDILRCLHTSDREIEHAVNAELTALGRSAWVVSVRLGVVRIEGPDDARQEHLARSTATAITGVRRVTIGG